MRIAPSLLAALAALAFPAAALAAPPANDNYLASVPVQSAEFQVTVDTSEATTQADTFNPNREGQPLTGGDPENLSCKGVGFGKTVWYDLAPTYSGAVDLFAASSSFAPAVALYEYDPNNPKTVRLIDCTTAVGGHIREDVEGKHAYTVQLGGVGGAGGPLNFEADYFPDRDEDGEFDALDKCPRVAGTVGGCPPELKAVPAINYLAAGGGIRITRLVVDRVPKGAKVVAKCSGCGTQTVKAKKAGRVTLTKLIGRTVRAGGNVEIRVTLRKTGNGDYRFGATGNYFRWPVSGGRAGTRVTRCLNVKSNKPERCS
jgi:hypothetical protein